MSTFVMLWMPHEDSTQRPGLLAADLSHGALKSDNRKEQMISQRERERERSRVVPQ